mgnify:CR=1 FL=1
MKIFFRNVSFGMYETKNIKIINRIKNSAVIPMLCSNILVQFVRSNLMKKRLEN